MNEKLLFPELFACSSRKDASCSRNDCFCLAPQWVARLGTVEGDIPVIVVSGGSSGISTLIGMAGATGGGHMAARIPFLYFIPCPNALCLRE